ncbi:MAG: DUF58 domain-containing protein [Candidatus Promineifilaceae bacterium]|nr:DUF58 domain-containing protein [Candidatus Promineifilaceae bacterium]
MAQFLLLIALLLAVAFFLQVDFVFYVVYVTLGVWLWSVWNAPRAVHGLLVRRRFRRRAFHGQKIDVDLELVHQGWQPIPWLQMVESIPPALRLGGATSGVLTLRGRSTRKVSYSVRAMRRGYYRLGPLLITTGDLFGFRESRRRLDPDYLTVYPRIIPLSDLDLPSRLPQGTIVSQKRFFEDQARPNGVRRYHSGDSLRHINWKVSAHSRRLQVKTYEPVISLESMILLNLNQSEYRRRQRYDGPEWAVIVAASVAAHLSEQRQPVGLACNGIDPLAALSSRDPSSFDRESGRLSLDLVATASEDGGAVSRSAARLMPGIIPPRGGRSNLMRILEQLARVESGATLESEHWMVRTTLDLSWGTNVIVVSPKGDDATCAALHQLVRRGLTPFLVIVDPYADFAAIRERARHLGFEAFHVGNQRMLSARQKAGQPRLRR